MKPLIQIILLTLLLYGCNNLNDLRPVDPATEIPEAAVQVVKAKFPKAEELVFRPILADKIWEVKLKSDADRYSSLVDFGKMWETFKVVPDGVPQPLEVSMKTTAFSGGTLSAYATSYFATTTPNKLMYSYKGENYSFEWSGLNPNVNSWASFDQSLYRITTFDVADLPSFVKDTLSKNPDAKFIRGITWVRLDDSKWYYVVNSQKSSYQELHLLFDEKGRLRWSSTGFMQPGVPNTASNLDIVPAQIVQYIQSQPELEGFEYDQKIVNKVRGLTSYYITVKVGGVSRCEFYFDQEFNLLNKKYMVVLY